MSEIKTEHSIGDLVYIASPYDVDRDVIKAIKVVGVKERVKYGIKKTRNHFDLMFGFNDEFTWYTPGQVFETKEKAQAHHERLKAKYDADRAKEEADQKKQRKLELEQELAELENE